VTLGSSDASRVDAEPSPKKRNAATKGPRGQQQRTKMMKILPEKVVEQSCRKVISTRIEGFLPLEV
jgi:hypothetical protein